MSPSRQPTRLANKPPTYRVSGHRQAKYLYVQVGAFKNKSNAIRLKARLSQLVRAPIQIATHYNSSLYLVRIGPLHNTETANRIIAHLRANGLKSTKVIDS